jgi:hypothetical protein
MRRSSSSWSAATSLQCSCAAIAAVDAVCYCTAVAAPWQLFAACSSTMARMPQSVACSVVDCAVAERISMRDCSYASDSFHDAAQHAQLLASETHCTPCSPHTFENMQFLATRSFGHLQRSVPLQSSSTRICHRSAYCQCRIERASPLSRAASSRQKHATTHNAAKSHLAGGSIARSASSSTYV